MPINSCVKGKVGEREVAAFIREFGFDAMRGQQHAGGNESPDVKSSMEGFHIEVKRTETLSLYPAMAQAERDKKPGDDALIFHRRNRQRWLVVMDGEAFMRMVRKYVFEMKEPD